MNEIESIAIKKYQDNLEYFQQNHIEVFKKINVLNNVIEDGSYVERFILEYKDDYFDVLEKSSGQYLYNQNSEDHAKKFAKNVNYKKSDSVIETFHRTSVSQALSGNFNDVQSPKSTVLYSTGALMQYTSLLSNSKTTMKSIDKFIFFGVGLGLHLMEVQQKIQAYDLYIIEDDLELFRLSLFVIDYQILSKKATLFFDVMNDKETSKDLFEKFFMEGYNYNHYLKYALFTDVYLSKIKFIQNYVVTRDYLAHPYNLFIDQLLKAPEYLVESYKYLNISKKHKNTPLSNKPVLLVAGGPSLDKNSEWLKKNHDKFIIVSVLAAVKYLYKLDIKPDIVTNMDPSDSHTKFLDGIDIESFLDKTLFIFSSVMSKKVTNLLPKENLYLWESTTHYKQDFGSLTSPSIGEVTYGLGLILGVCEFYLLGLDLALDAKTKRTHSASHIHAKTLDDSEGEENEFSIDLLKTLSYVKGNFLEEVPTLPLFKTSIDAFMALTKLHKSDDQNIYNLNDGAFLSGAKPIKSSEIDVEAFQRISEIDKMELKSFLDSISDPINIKDTEYLEYQIVEAKRLQNVINEHKKSVSRTLTSAYLKSYASLIHELLGISNENKRDINSIMYYYSRYMSTFIFDFFNTKEIKNPKKHIKKIDNILISQLEKMLKLYVVTMEVYLEYGNMAVEETKEVEMA